MAIPKFHAFLLPFLKFTSDGEEHVFNEVLEYLKNEFQITDEESEELLPSGKQTILKNRIAWARTYLKKAGLIDYVRRGVFQITERGREVLLQKPEKIDTRFLMQFPEFQDFIRPKRGAVEPTLPPDEDEISPKESVEYGYQKARDSLAQELLETVKSCTPEFFERLVVDLLINMGYGGSRKDAGEAVGKSGDGGIDGIIKEDRLGLDAIYIQAKKWEGTVGRPEIRSS